MRLSHPPTLLSLLAVILSSTHTVRAVPFLDPASDDNSSILVERSCAYPCGQANPPICCGGPGECYTDSNNQAQCSGSVFQGGSQQISAATPNNGQYQVYTTTYVSNELVTITSTYSSLLGSATAQVAGSGTLSCDTSVGESYCGTSCCASGQLCSWQMTCVAAGGNDVSSSYFAGIMTTPATGSPYARPTQAFTSTTTLTGSITTTMPVGTPLPTASSGGSTAGMQSTTSNNGLSGGQIAGIVIGVLLGILLLLIICGCLCFKGLLDSVLALFGLGPKRRRRTEVIEERYSHHHSGAGGSGGRRWFGQGPSRPQKEKKKGGLGGALGVGAGLGALALLLGLKRKRDDRRKDDEASYTSYSYSDYTSASSESTRSADRRTRDTRRSRR